MSDLARAPLVLAANARLPSERAQTLQVVQMAAAFARAGVPTTLLHARRWRTPRHPDRSDLGDHDALLDHYGVPPGARPGIEAAPCLDGVDLVPRFLQVLPARLQELSFACTAALRLGRQHAGARVLTREIEIAAALAGRPGVFLEVHRVPGGWIRRRWLRRAARSAAGIVAISGGVRVDLLEAGVEGAGVIVEHDGFEAARFEGLPTRAEARAILDLPPDAPLVVYAGGLLAWKGVDVLVQAATQLPDVHFVIAGGMAADVARLRERTRGRAKLRVEGFQPPARVPLYLAAADLGVVPNRSRPAISARHTSPLKVFEAMAVGLPLVASDLPSLREVLGDEEAWFVPPDEPGLLADGIRRALADGAGRAERGERLRARAAEHTWDARAARLLAWMEERG